MFQNSYWIVTVAHLTIPKAQNLKRIQIDILFFFCTVYQNLFTLWLTKNFLLTVLLLYLILLNLQIPVVIIIVIVILL